MYKAAMLVNHYFKLNSRLFTLKCWQLNCISDKSNPTAKNNQTLATCHSTSFTKCVLYPKETVAWFLPLESIQ